MGRGARLRGGVDQLGEGRADERQTGRADRKELDPEVQARVQALWPQVTSENVYQLTDFAGYKQEFLRLFGFEVEGVDYEADVDPAVEIRGLI